MKSFAAPGEPSDARRAAFDQHPEHTDIGVRRDADQLGAPKLRAAGEDHAEALRRLRAVLAGQDMLVRDHRAHRVDRKGGATESLAVGVLDQHDGDRVLIAV